ncbi:MAG: YceD family protein [Pseudomonadota bacterium]
MKTHKGTFDFKATLQVDAGPLRFSLNATPEQQADAASRLDVVAVTALAGEGVIKVKGAKGAVREAIIEGVASAALTRRCVASLEPMDEDVETPFKVRLVEAVDEEDSHSDDDVDLLDGDAVDVGDLLIQQVALAMQPYPRKADAPSFPKADAPPTDSASPQDTKTSGAFADLKTLLNKDG